MRAVTVSLLWMVLCGCSEGNGAAALTIQGSACAVAIDYTSEAAIPLTVYRDGTGALRGVEVSGGDAFDHDDLAAWARYATDYDVYALLAFHDPESPAPHSITSLEESVLAARGVGVIGIGEESAGSIVAIETLDWSANELALHFSLTVATHNSDYPPSSGGLAMCAGDTVTGMIAGSFGTVLFERSERDH